AGRDRLGVLRRHDALVAAELRPDGVVAAQSVVAGGGAVDQAEVVVAAPRVPHRQLAAVVAEGVAGVERRVGRLDDAGGAGQWLPVDGPDVADGVGDVRGYGGQRHVRRDVDVVVVERAVHAGVVHLDRARPGRYPDLLSGQGQPQARGGWSEGGPGQDPGRPQLHGQLAGPDVDAGRHGVG